MTMAMNYGPRSQLLSPSPYPVPNIYTLLINIYIQNLKP